MGSDCYVDLVKITEHSTYSLCPGSTHSYSTDAGMADITWTVSPGNTIISGAGTDTVVVQWNVPGQQTISVNYTYFDLCAANSPTVYSVSVDALPVPTITGTSSVCAGTTGVTYSTESGKTGYNWNVSTGGTIIAGAGTNTITVDWNTAGAQTLSVTYSNGAACLAPNPTVFNVTVYALPVPAITGDLISCVGASGVTYTTASGMTNYTWAVSAGGAITAGASTNSITVTWNTLGPQTVSVNYTNSNSCTAINPTVAHVTVNPLPVAPVITQSNDTLYSNAATGNQWYSVASGLIPGATNKWYKLAANGVYYDIVTTNSCSSDTSNLFTVNNLSVENYSLQNAVKVYPNPTTDLIYIEQADDHEATIRLLNISGKLVYSSDIFGKKNKIDITNLPAGFYTLQYSSNETSSVVKIVKMK